MWKIIDQFLCRVFDENVSIHLYEFLEEHDLLFNIQFVFRKQYLTSHAIIALVDQVSRAFNAGKIDVGVFLPSFQKSF